MAITQAIPAQAFEVIRNRIGEIIANEFTAQKVITPSWIKPTVWVERYYTFDSEIELPAVNITFSGGSYLNENIVRSQAEYIYNINVSTASPSTSTANGDKLALLQMQKIVGMIRAILMNPIYVKLGYANNAGIVISRRIESIRIGDKKDIQDALSDVVGQIVLVVNAIETTELGTGVEVQMVNSHVTLDESEQGLFFNAEI
jgi:hypothetical protein